MSIEYQKHLRSRQKYVSVNDWNHTEYTPVVPHYPIDRHNLLILVLYMLQIVDGTVGGGGDMTVYGPVGHPRITIWTEAEGRYDICHVLIRIYLPFHSTRCHTKFSWCCVFCFLCINIYFIWLCYILSFYLILCIYEFWIADMFLYYIILAKKN